MTILSLSLNIVTILCIPHSVELQKANLQETNNQTSPNTNGGNQSSQSALTASSSSSSTTSNINPLASAIPLAQLLAKPGALNALNSLSALGGLTDLLGGLVNIGGSTPIQTTGVHRSKNYTPRIRSPGNGSLEKKGDRNKFNPY